MTTTYNKTKHWDQSDGEERTLVPLLEFLLIKMG